MLFELFENMNKLMESINVDQQKRDEIIELTKKQRNETMSTATARKLLTIN